MRKGLQERSLPRCAQPQRWSAVGKQIPWCWVLPLPLQQLNFLPLLGFPLPCLISLWVFQLLFPIPTVVVDLNSAAFGTPNCLWLCNLWLQVPLSLLFLPTSAVQLQDMHRKVHTSGCDKAEFVPAEFFCPACAECAVRFVSSHISSSGWAGFCIVCLNELTESFRLVGSS